MADQPSQSFSSSVEKETSASDSDDDDDHDTEEEPHLEDTITETETESEGEDAFTGERLEFWRFGNARTKFVFSVSISTMQSISLPFFLLIS